MLGYQNVAANHASGPNAMLLHLPGVGMTRDCFVFYARLYPEHAVALCCFDNRDAARSAPLLLWYEPRHPDRWGTSSAARTRAWSRTATS